MALRFDLTDRQSRTCRKIFYLFALLASFLTMCLGASTISKYTGNPAHYWYSSSHNFIVFAGALTTVLSLFELTAYWIADRSTGPVWLQWCVHTLFESILMGVQVLFWFIGSIAIAVTTKANSCDSSYLITGSSSACHTARATLAFSFITMIFVMLIMSTLLRDLYRRNLDSHYGFTNVGIGPGPHQQYQSSPDKSPGEEPYYPNHHTPEAFVRSQEMISSPHNGQPHSSIV
ncbi:hypothetical protein IWQ62_006530 [Dispira parvispora]|uniref:MARVEL domain-containing protein n=1 Tax=Dispira parvispora TaxID=1520584 RepID=A0A9W8E482_9FUNG|nr:hypothetical protein IWQ62_006530 [Dispira parvispora]